MKKWFVNAKRFFKNYKEGFLFLKYIEFINGDFNKHIKNIRQDDIWILSKACKLFITGEFRANINDRESIELFSQLIVNDIEKNTPQLE